MCMTSYTDISTMKVSQEPLTHKHTISASINLSKAKQTSNMQQMHKAKWMNKIKKNHMKNNKMKKKT